MTQTVRIKDIAKLAGVSVGTVDRVLHNRGRVSSKALKKVLQVLEQIDYKPNLIARTLGANKTYRLAALIPNPDQDPYWNFSKAGLKLAEAEWLRYGVTVEPYFFNLYDKKSFTEVAETVSNTRPDGVLVAPIFYQESLRAFELFRENMIPYVLFNTQITESEAMCFIGQNLYQSGRVGGELMWLALQCSAGLVLVVHVNEDLDNSVHLAEKEKGFREYFESKHQTALQLKTLNLTSENFEEHLVRAISDSSLKGIFVTTSKGVSAVASLLERHQKTGVTMIGYDLLQENIEFMKKGVVNFLINQNPKRQAFLGIHHLAGQLVLKKNSPNQNLLPLEVISQENLESYLNSEIH